LEGRSGISQPTHILDIFLAIFPDCNYQDEGTTICHLFDLFSQENFLQAAACSVEPFLVFAIKLIPMFVTCLDMQDAIHKSYQCMMNSEASNQNPRASGKYSFHWHNHGITSLI
jgi:hypothetical protein